MTRWIRWLDESSSADVSVLGGKIAHLATLRRAGITTPDGFAVMADAYVAAVAASAAGAELDALVKRLEADPSQVHLAAACADLVLGLTLPEDVVDEVTSAYDRLASQRREAFPRVAVRSSALKEDGTDASSAGQYDTYLGICGSEAVVSAVRRCWASLFSEHAVLYRARQGVRVAQTPMAVGVIELVNARASGVAFSLHPVTGDPERLVVESTFGFGESLVQGHVTPDHFEVDRTGLNVLEHRVADKLVVSTWSDRGTEIEERAMPEPLRRTSSIDTAEVTRVAEVLLEVERHFDCSVDMEWVWPPDPATEPVVVQARAETVHRLTSAQLGATGRRAGFDPIAYALARTFGTTGGKA